MGFVAHIPGVASRGIVVQALEVLHRMRHRGATGADPLTGDGAGILTQLPRRFFERQTRALGITLPRGHSWGVAQLFLPTTEGSRAACERILVEIVESEGQRVLGWRDVPFDDSQLGPLARSSRPMLRQLFIGRRRVVPGAFERTLFVIRKLAENAIRDARVDPNGSFHIASLSSETIVYKGLLLPAQLPRFYRDLGEPDFESAIAVVHSRFSTNTFPAWDLAQPFRMIAHNGEINTLQGNRNWVHSRRSLLQSAKFVGGLERLQPFIVPDKSDSAQFDNMLELLVLGGRALPHAMMLMIPEAWDGAQDMPEARRAFYEYASSLMEPWDGPAAIAFTDGHLVGATLDRNGLRPARYVVTDDDRVILASEAGVLDIPPERVRKKGRLQPGRMFLVDVDEGRIIEDDDVKHDIVTRWPYRRWLDRNVFTFAELGDAAPTPPASGESLARLQRAFGYTDEDLRLLIAPMGDTGKEPTGSMGQDAPLAVLSDRAPSLFDYFHQLFAQVTNPPIDPLRETLVMSLATSIGPGSNTFEETPEQCHQLTLPGPTLTNAQMARILAIGSGDDFQPRILPLLFDASKPHSLSAAVDVLCQAAADAVEAGNDLLVLSDRGTSSQRAAIPALLAVSAVHQRLVRDGIRSQTGLVVETGDAREVHHVAALIAYGAAAVNPWLALDSVRALCPGVPDAEARFVHALDEGLLKVMSKMGISTVLSYRGAQMFEAVGLDSALVDEHFSGTPSRLSGIGIDGLGREACTRHARGFGPLATDELELPVLGGVYQWRRRGELHKWNPATIAALQHAARTNDAEAFTRYERLADDESDAIATLRGLLEMKSDRAPIPLDEVEPALELARRFVTGAMSFGSISAEAHETLAIAMNRLGARSNSGEGGEEARRYVPDENGDLRRSAIKQVASARFGVTAEYLVNAAELQIKIAQGAKPGEGGQIPGYKVDARIAAARCSTAGVTLISPPPHHDIYSIEDLAQLIYDLTAVNPQARISVKLVSEFGVGTVAAGVVKAGAGGVTVSGYEGGTGASPLSSIKHAGLPWELGLAEAQQVLVQNGLRERVRLQVDGGLRTSRDIIVAALLGAEEFGLATASLVAEGCVMLRKCHLNTCSVGIATQDPALRARFAGRPEDVVQFFLLLAEHIRKRLAALGVRKLEELVGRVEWLRQRSDVKHWKARRLDLSPLLAAPNAAADAPRRCIAPQSRDVSDLLDHALVAQVESALEGKGRATIETAIHNAHRAVGAGLSGLIARRYGAAGLPDDSIHIRLTGTAGQSFGAFLARGLVLELHGDANDYVGKGLSGGRIILRPSASSPFAPEENVIAGNTVLYGATAGEAFLSGLVGERFAVRNSGATAVVEGVGDHACEYMTGGTVIVLGPTGRNFAAGMSGGTAYVFDEQSTLCARSNLDMVELVAPRSEDLLAVHRLVERHAELTGSAIARRVLETWAQASAKFVKVQPIGQAASPQVKTAPLLRVAT